MVPHRGQGSCSPFPSGHRESSTGAFLRKRRPGSQWQTQWFSALQHPKCVHALHPEEPLSLKVSFVPSCFTQPIAQRFKRWQCWFCVSLPASASRCVRPGRSQVTKKSDFRGRLAVFYYTRNEASPEKTLNNKYANSDLGVCFGFFLHFIIENIRYAQKCRASDCVPVTTIT